MRRWAILAAVLAAMALQTGCGGDGMAYSRRERMHRAERILRHDMRQYADDVDLFWLNDQQLRTTKWSIE